MPKLSKEEKLKLVRRYIGGHCVPTPEGYRSRTAFKASLLAWAKRYRMYGEKGLERKAKTAAGALDKAEAVRRCLSDKEKLKVLREEYEYLRTENAVLKKLRALGERKEAARKKRR